MSDNRVALQLASAEGISSEGFAEQPSSNLSLTWMGEEDRLPPRKWLIKGLLGQGELSVLFAPSGGGKSFVGLDLAARIASGLKWFDHTVTQCPVLYVAGEGATGFRYRMTAWRKKMGVHEPPFALLPRSLDMFAAGGSGPELINQALAEVEDRIGVPVGLIVLDTLSRMMPGGVDSDPRDMKNFLDNIEKLRTTVRTHIQLVHHTGKERDRGMRGSSMLRDYADTVIEIKAPLESGPHCIQIDKQKDGEDGRKYHAQLVPITVGTDEDGEPITSCILEPVGVDDVPKKMGLVGYPSLAMVALHEALRNEGISPTVTLGTGDVTRCVTVEAWKREFMERLSARHEGADRSKAWPRVTWHRAAKHLINNNLAATVWFDVIDDGCNGVPLLSITHATPRV